MIGSLLYMIASRPDVMFSVCMCARFQASPRESHLKATKRILRYLKYTPNIGLWYPKGAKFELVGYSNLDSDASGNMVDQKLYRSMIGSLLYVTASWLDVMFSVYMCARFQASPRETHLKATKRILWYLKHTQNVGL